MAVKASPALKRKRVTSRRDGADNILKCLIKDAAASRAAAKMVLVVDVGGTSVKILVTGQIEGRSFPSGRALTPARSAMAAAMPTAWP